jgi:hypothetical protein
MVTNNSPYSLGLQLENWDTDLFPRVNIFVSSTAIAQSPVDLNHVSNGYYYNQFTPSSEGYYSLQSIVYTDSAHTTSSNSYGVGMEVIKVDSIEDDITYMSGQLPLGGGGGPKTYVVAGKKSPWTHAQRDKLLKDSKEAKQKLNKLSKEVKEYHDEQMKYIEKFSDALLTKIDALLDVIYAMKRGLAKVSDKEDISNVIMDVDNVISLLRGYKAILEKSPTFDDITKVMNKIDEIDKTFSAALFKTVPREDLYENISEEDLVKLDKKLREEDDE